MFRETCRFTFRFIRYSVSTKKFVLSLSARCILLVFSCLLPALALSQRLPSIPAEVNFGGETIFLNAQAQQRLQEEVTSIYADRLMLRNAIEQMHYVESLLMPMLEERSIPADFRYVCLPTSTSSGAYWNLDARKANRLNLRMDASVDERLNLASSSEAVLGELAVWHTKYPNWNWIRVLLNYAAGQRPDDPPSAIQPGGSRLPNDQLQLPAESPALVWVVLARKVVFEYESQFLGPNATPSLLYDYRQGRDKSLSAIARELGLEQDRFMPFNEWLRVRVIPNDKVYPVLIRLTPTEFTRVKSQVNSTIQLGQPPQAGVRPDIGFPVLRKLPASASKDNLITRTSTQFYEINDRKGVQAQSCDNVITLAYYGQLSVRSFMAINEMTDRDMVRPGEIYYLKRKARKAKIPFHVMQVGQSLRDVSAVYGIQLKYLLKYNHLVTNQRLLPGRILWLREKRPANLPAEYQVLPEPIQQSEPIIARQNVTPQTQDPVIDKSIPPTPRLPPVDSASGSRGNRSIGVAKPTDSNGNDPVDATNTPAVKPEQTVPQQLYHIVREGDTHSGVAQRYNVPLADLISWNNLSYRKPLVVGQQLLVRKAQVAAPQENRTLPTTPVLTEKAATPVDTIVRKPAIVPARPKPKPVVNPVRVERPKATGIFYYHTVQPGQTMYRVALINKVSVENVMRWNNLTQYTIEVGQRLLIKK